MDFGNNPNYLTKHYLTQTIQAASNIDKGLKIFCEDHPAEIITNFCCIMDCLKPLCPECIDYHNKYHKQNQQYPEIDTLRNVKINCSKKVKAAILSLAQELEKLEVKYMINPQDIIDEGLETLKRCRERALQLVNAFFDSLEANYKRKLNESIFRGHDYNSIFEKIKNLIQELEFLQNNLESGSNTINVIKKICLLDLKTLLDKHKLDIQQLIESRSFMTTEIMVNETRLSIIESELSKYVFFNDPKQGKLSQSFVLNNSNQNKLSFQENSFSNNNQIDLNDQKRNILLNEYSTPSKERGEKVKKTANFVQSNNSETNLNNYNMNNLSNSNSGLKSSNYYKTTSFSITTPDYFDAKTPHKVLHFFPNCQKLLFLLDFEKLKNDSSTRFELINLEIDFRIPHFHKSIITPQGDIYLLGGSLPDNSGRKSNKAYIYDWSNKTLREMPNMIYGRSSHGICYLNGCIYVIGGFLNGQVFNSKCEKYTINSRSWKQIASLNYNCVACSVTSFNNQYLFKFGGLLDGLLPNNYIERYDIAHDSWSLIDARLEINDKSRINPKNFKLFSTTSCVQINKNEIIVFGGYKEDNAVSNTCFIFTNEGEEENEYAIKNIDIVKLPYAEGFWTPISTVMYKNVFALQNVPNDKNDDCLENERRILVFNSQEWISLN